MRYQFIGKIQSFKIDNQTSEYLIKFRFDNYVDLAGKDYGILQCERNKTFVFAQSLDFVNVSLELFDFLLKNREETFTIDIEIKNKTYTPVGNGQDDETDQRVEEFETVCVKPIKSLLRRKTDECVDLSNEAKENEFDDIEDLYEGEEFANVMDFAEEIEEDEELANESDFKENIEEIEEEVKTETATLEAYGECVNKYFETLTDFCIISVELKV